MTAPPRLALDRVARTFDGVAVVDDLSLEIAAGEVLCLLGPSGCGKTTTLRIAAGVERQSSGRVLLEGVVVSDANRHEPPERRSVGLMFQDFALFPHLDIAANIAFGLSGPKRERGAVAERFLERVGLKGFGGKYPHMLSGGEQQRVALARALAPNPRVMLMDEPFSGLDNRLRDAVRDQALSILKAEGTAVLLVTHDPEEAMRMADRIALMRKGRIVQTGAPYNVYNRPVDREAASFLSDVNVIHGVVRNRQTDTPFGLFLTPKLIDGADVEIIVRPEHLKVDLGENGPPAANVKTGVPAAGTVVRARFVGAESLIEVRMEHDGARLISTVPGAFLPEEGARVWLSLRRDHCHLFPCRVQSHVSDPYISTDARTAAE
ncbi:ABC transporter ATP-binding protein [Pikeienuella piscinae]|uniref:ABC transporter ATP-binding protein n=1 Tax=Pikeienuella piscinae TaxID=2748098 RepID=A0A7L5BUD5_9RHOB|nr:ABC transporter ATP-binding protein [Pikeienuella piscinae]QIE54288.1 ABC transporter ATP-binding protein [Pikeienuella piscinae]